MKKHGLLALVVCAIFVAVFALTIGLSFNNTTAMAEEGGVNVRVAHITDLHFYPEELSNEKSSAYLAKKESETKFLGESGASLRKTFESMVGTAGNIKEDAPTYVLVSGDLTLNGEKIGHEGLAKIFADITEMVRQDPKHEDFQILVVPGNHDIFNPSAKRYYPTQEEIDACGSAEEVDKLLSDYVKYTPTVDNQEFMDIYWSFGYAEAGEVNPRTGEVSKLSDKLDLEFFFNSDEWYDDDLGVMTVHPPKDVHEIGEDTKDYSVYNPYVRHGACSYIARSADATIVAVDGNSRKYIGENAGLLNDDKSFVYATAEDWEETTSGDLEDRILRWICKSIKTDVANDKLVLGMFHHNIVPHFTMEGDVLSMFTYDDYKRAIEVLPDAGLKYVFTGHMHSSDIAYSVSQNGNVIYDFETGSTIGLGAAYRIAEFETSGKGETYTEDVYTQVFNLDESVEYFTADSNVAKKTTKHFEYFKNKMKNLVPTMIGGMVNENLYDNITGAMSGINADHPFFGALAIDGINDLSNLDLYPIVVDDNGNARLAKNRKEGYDIVAFVNSLVNYLCEFDFSYGTVTGGYKMDQLLFDIYGGHMMGTNPSEIPDNLVAFFSKLEDGTFVQWLVDLVYNTVVPQLDLILDSPIRYNSKTATLTESGVQGFDFTRAFDLKLSAFSVDNIVRGLINQYAFGAVDEYGVVIESYLDENGYSSLRYILTAISKNAPSVVDSLLNSTILGPLLEGFNIQSIFDEYFDLVLNYLVMYFDSDLSTVLKSELLDKYVTKAFCSNLGNYAKDILVSLAVDESYDGGYLDEEGVLHNEKVHLQFKYNDKVVYGEHSFSKNKVEIVPSADNGLLPAQVAVSNVTKDGILSDSEIKLKWTTHITVDIFNYTCPDSFIKFATSVDGVKNATPIKATGKNVEYEYPTIDLGIAYLNMSYVYDVFNKYSVKLTGLNPDTVYYYSLGNDDSGWTDVRSFRTPKSQNADSFTIMGITDIQGSIEKNYTDALQNLLLGKDIVPDASFVITLGDNVDNGKSIYQYYWMLEGQKEFWSQNSFVGVPGNHEDGENEMSEHVLIPNDETNLEYYSFVYVNTCFIMLNTNDLKSDGTLSEAQYNWLISVLTNASNNEQVKWIVVGMHKGLFTAGSHAYDSDVVALRNQLNPIFVQYGVDVVLQGHDHTYSVTNTIGADGKAIKTTTDSRGAIVNSDGVIYINLGTMGDKFYDYIYSDAIDSSVFVKRDSVNKELAQYLTADKYLELTETPVFMSLSADANDLTIKTYTIKDGKVIDVDNIILTNNPVNSVLTAGQIAAISVGCAAFVAVVVLSSILIVRKRKLIK